MNVIILRFPSPFQYYNKSNTSKMLQRIWINFKIRHMELLSESKKKYAISLLTKNNVTFCSWKSQINRVINWHPDSANRHLPNPLSKIKAPICKKTLFSCETCVGFSSSFLMLSITWFLLHFQISHTTSWEKSCYKYIGKVIVCHAILVIFIVWKKNQKEKKKKTPTSV